LDKVPPRGKRPGLSVPGTAAARAVGGASRYCMAATLISRAENATIWLTRANPRASTRGVSGEPETFECGSAAGQAFSTLSRKTTTYALAYLRSAACSVAGTEERSTFCWPPICIGSAISSAAASRASPRVKAVLRHELHRFIDRVIGRRSEGYTRDFARRVLVGPSLDRVRPALAEGQGCGFPRSLVEKGWCRC